MSELVPATEAAVPEPRGSLFAPLTDPVGGSFGNRFSAFAGQPAIRRMLPWFVGMAALGGLALTWSTLAPSPQRTLYSQLDDSERANVADALDKASIRYHIDNNTGQITVDEGDYYRARMLVASDSAIATPQSGSDMLDSLPMGASRALEGERLRAAREHDLMLTIQQIDGVESVRVHLAEGEKSVFVRDNLAPSASVMVRLARGRQLSERQVNAIVNLVAGSVPGLSPDAVRVVDQHGHLLSDKGNADSDRLDLQARMEDKLQNQVSALLTPMFGEGNFSSEVQVDLDMDEVTSARESYDKDGAVRQETQQQSQTMAPQQAVGVPGALSNSPPPAATAVAGPPQGTPTATASQSPLNDASSSSRTYEVGRAVSVSNNAPGGVKRLSVAVALSAKALKGTKPADLEQIKQLIGAAVGADPKRGDQITVIARNFEPVVDDKIPFYETAWFATLVRYGSALLGLLLALLLGVRPLVKALRGPTDKKSRVKGRKRKGKGAEEDGAEDADDEVLAIEGRAGARGGEVMLDNHGVPLDDGPAQLSEKVGLAKRLVAEKPDSALAALRQMLKEPQAEGSVS